jgi:hypothetical protein
LLIRAVSDWLEMDCTPSGTIVDVSFRLSAGTTDSRVRTAPEGLDRLQVRKLPTF